MGRGEVRTTFALQATALATQFNELFGAVKIPPGFVATLTAPEGPSTGGGVQSVQHIRLTGEGPALVMGHLDTKEMTAVVRTYAHLQRQRRGTALSLDHVAYSAFSNRVKAFAESLHFVVTIEDAAPEAALPAAPAAKSSGGGFWAGFVIGGIVFGAIAAVVTYVLTHR